QYECAAVAGGCDDHEAATLARTVIGKRKVTGEQREVIKRVERFDNRVVVGGACFVHGPCEHLDCFVGLHRVGAGLGTARNALVRLHPRVAALEHVGGTGKRANHVIDGVTSDSCELSVNRSVTHENLPRVASLTQLVDQQSAGLVVTGPDHEVG